MILVVTEKLDLTFLLQHQGECLRATRTAHEALQVLRTALPSISGIILDDRVENSRLVASYVRANAPTLRLVSWRIAERNSPFRHLRDEGRTEWKPGPAHSRYQYKRKESR
jgi:hypothetical protein